MKKNKQIISVLMASVLLSSSTISYATTFKDMKNSKGKDHWSLPFVTDISTKGLVGGYSDGTFKPNKAVSRLESVVFISRLFPIETVKATYNENKSKWDAKLKANEIPEFAKSSVVFGLENNWFTEAYIKEFMNIKTKTQKDAQRYEFGVYLVRALDWTGELSNAAAVSYKDAKSIPKQAVPYIELLGKKGIIATSGEFNPLKPVTRGEVAKMLSIAYKHSAKANGKTEKSDTNNTGNNTSNTQNTSSNLNNTLNQTPVMPSGTMVEGKIKQVTIDNYNIILLLTDNSGRLLSYTNRASGVIISLDGKYSDALSLKEGYEARLYTDGTTLKGVDAKSIVSVNKTLSGEIAGITSNFIKVRSGNATEEFAIDPNVNITKDGKMSRIGELTTGDSVYVTVKNSSVASIEAKTVRKVMKNVVIKSVTSYSSGSATITVADERGNTFNMEFTSLSTAYMNNKKADLSAIVVGYEADIYADSNIILDITLFGEAKGTVVTGTVTSIDLRNDIFYIKRSDGKELKVLIARRVEVVDQLTQKSKSVSDIEVGKNVVLNGFDGATQFEASRIAIY